MIRPQFGYKVGFLSKMNRGKSLKRGLLKLKGLKDALLHKINYMTLLSSKSQSKRF